MRLKILAWILVVGTALVVVLLVAVALIDEPLRRFVERQVNQRTEDYAFRIGRLDLHPLTLGIDLYDLTVTQQEHPDPPLAHIPKWSAGVDWRGLLSGRLVSEHRIERPVIHWTRPQAIEAKEDVEEAKEAMERRWQEVVESIYPITIRTLIVTGGDVTYVDHPDAQPLRLTDLTVRLANVRNQRAQRGEYPSDVYLEGRVFQTGTLRVTGKGDVMAIPYPAVLADMTVDSVPLANLTGLLGRYHVQITQGQVSLEGRVEHTPTFTRIELRRMTAKNVKIDYVYAVTTPHPEFRKAKEAAEVSQAALNEPGFLVKLDRATVENSELGFVNKTANPQYRVFLGGTDVYLENVSNHLSEGTAVVRLRGMLQGSGATTVVGTFRPESPLPDFDLNVQIMKTRLPALNDLFRAYANLDLAAGTFSFFSELTVKDGRIDGYVKPLFESLDVYERRQDRGKGLLQQAYEGVIGGLSALLSSTPRDTVATKADVSGPVQNPSANTWDVVINLVRNAFFESILPGLTRQAT